MFKCFSDQKRLSLHKVYDDQAEFNALFRLPSGHRDERGFMAQKSKVFFLTSTWPTNCRSCITSGPDSQRLLGLASIPVFPDGKRKTSPPSPTRLCLWIGSAIATRLEAGTQSCETSKCHWLKLRAYS